MSFAEATLTPRHLGAILTGLCKKNFYDNAISLNDLAVFYADSGLSEEGVLQHSGLLEQLLRKAAHENMTPENMESAAAEFQLQPALVETLSRFWRTERSKVSSREDHYPPRCPQQIIFLPFMFHIEPSSTQP